MRKLLQIIIHHNGGDALITSDGKGLYKLTTDPVHLKSRGILSPAEYHYIVARNGNVIQCAKDDVALGHSNVATVNSNSIAICFEGNFHTYNGHLAQFLDGKQRDAGVKLILALCRKYGISTIKGHREVIETACPGNNFPLDAIRMQVLTLLAAPPKIFVFWPQKSEATVMYKGDNYGAYTITLASPPFISVNTGWIPLSAIKSLKLTQTFPANKNGNVKLTDFAKVLNMNIKWEPKDRKWIIGSTLGR